jgi:hypothetical protein
MHEAKDEAKQSARQAPVKAEKLAMVHEASELHVDGWTSRCSSLSFGSWKTIRPPLQQISWRAFQCIAEFVQNVGSVALAPFVKKRMQGWVGNPGHLLEFVARPALTF